MKFGLEKWIIIATVVTVATLQMIDTSIVNVTLLQMMGSLGATLGDISWVITSYAAANVIMPDAKAVMPMLTCSMIAMR